MPSWTEQARSAGREKYLRWDPGQEIELKIIEGPREHEFNAKDGKLVKAWEWDVTVDGEPKVMSVTSRRLLLILADEEDECPMEGCYFRIKAMGSGMDRQWRVRRLERVRSAPVPLPVEEDEEEEVSAPPPKPKKPAPAPVPVREVDSIDEFEEAAAKIARPKKRKKRADPDDEEDE